MGKIKNPEPFQFKQFAIHQEKCSMKVGTDGILLGAWAPVEKTTTALDIGTGTGLIALMLAQGSCCRNRSCFLPAGFR